MNKILDELNEEQRQAASHIDGALLILAGAGSGKTKTLTTRLAYLIDEIGIPPSSTLTLTFTNKAAGEMRQKALNLISHTSSLPLLCTFHKFGLMFLKFYIHLLDRKANFVLIDSDDRKKILKTLDNELPFSLISFEISRMKNYIISPKDAAKISKEKIYRDIARIYEAYNAYMLQNNMVDFDDLLLLTYQILEQNPNLCDEISQKYSYIMVDEYQDTNELQYKILKKLTYAHNNICVVGDDDQSIYGWRGADINNILNFKDNFKNAKIVLLQKNYRSTTQILTLANKLIAFNTERLGKELISIKGNGAEVELIESIDERLESQNIALKIKKLLNNGVKPKDIAILFRINSLSRSIEDGLNKEAIAYKLIGAVRFYERAEIKDILSYFRLVINLDDNFSFLRIINRPKRGIGKATQDKLENFAKEKNISIYQAINNFRDEIPLSQKHINVIVGIFDTLILLKERLDSSTLGFLELFKEKINILDTFENIQDDVDREANVDEFYGFFKDYIIQNPTASLEDFLNDISLSSDDNSNDREAISCMSVHSSKGLEFEHIFVIGLEEGFFPLISDSNDIQEERRLGYVAFTRAKSNLYLSFAKSRFYKGKRTQLYPSRFLKESGIIDNGALLKQGDDSFKKNDLVFHKVFGAGRVVSVDNDKLKINFGGIEKIILSSFVTKT